MNQCPTCKAMLEPGVRFCPNDGTPLTDTAAALGSPTPTGGRRSASVELQLPLVVGERYTLMELRGGGGMAKVYKAEDRTLQRIVAVKLMNPELRTEAEFDARFQREARIASQLQDPHIVPVHDFGIDPTHGPFLVMEFLEGQSLRERLNSGGPLPLKAGLQIGGQLLLALMHAHNKGIIHRDIKPDNIFLMTQSGVRMHVRVLDFGIARILRRDDQSLGHALTSPGAVLGTPRYMSPEQLAGQQLDARSDVFSAALVIYEALTGQLPYVTGKRLCEVCPEATPALQDLLEHCLKPAVHDRPQAALEAYLRLQELGKASGVILLPPGAIEAILRGRKSGTPPGTPAPVPTPTVPYGSVPPKPPKRRRLLIGLLALLAVLSVAAGAWWYFSPSKRAHGAKESLLGIEIGDGRKEAMSKLDRMDVHRWSQRKEVLLGNVLKPPGEVLGLSDEELENLDVAWTENQKVVVLFHDDKVKAVIVHEPNKNAVTARDARIGSSGGAVFDLYADAGMKHVTVDEKKSKTQVTIQRCDKLGVGFELHDNKVTGITLYPPTEKK